MVILQYLLNVCCANGTCGEARVGVTQALAGCGGNCGLLMPVHKTCVNCECYAEQFFPDIEKMKSLLPRQGLGGDQHKLAQDKMWNKVYYL